MDCFFNNIAGGGGGGDEDIAGVISRAQFNDMLKHRNDGNCPDKGFYTCDAFAAAANRFLSLEQLVTTLWREIAAFLGPNLSRSYWFCNYIFGREKSSHGLRSWAHNGSWAQSILNLGTCNSANLSIPATNLMVDEDEVAILTLSASSLFLSSISISSSFRKNWGSAIVAKRSSCWPQYVMVSMDVNGEPGEASCIAFIPSSIAALCSNTFSDVAFRYILHKTMSSYINKHEQM
ncbi:Glycoside hydrolase, family 19, catalytic [Dillenia turbinata]|uniref:Glycoside hydrolase, family 19, catalytic n=1 Tax=Dillenia turbinata TaxID=194707 RepID=A0AAN8UWK3_9MAGN